MEQLQVKRPLYPLLALLSSLLIFCIGLLVAKKISFLYLMGSLTIVYLIFGFGKVLFKVIPIFLGIGLFIGIGAALTSQNYMTGLQTIGRVVVLAYSSIVMVTLPPINLTRNLVQLKFPRAFTLGMLITIRFVPLLINESKQIKEAMRTRGVKISITNKNYIYRAFLIPFITRIIHMSDIMAVSVETRGFVLEDKSNVVYKEVKPSIRDGIFAGCILVILIGVMCYG